MSYGITHYQRPWRGDLGVGKRPDEQPRPDHSSELIGMTEAANLLGMKPKAFIQLVRDGGFPAERIRGRIYLRRGDVERRLAGEP